MKWSDWLWSLMLHGTVVGAVMVAGALHLTPEQDERLVPVYFEVIEAAGEGGELQPTVPEEAPERIPPDEAHEGTRLPEHEDASLQEEDVVEEVVKEIPEQPPEEQTAYSEITPYQMDATDSALSDEKSFPLDALPQEGDSLPNDMASMQEEERAQVVSDPIALNRIVPVYPRSARRKGHEGSVTVEISVAEDGGIASAEVVVSSGHAELDAAALGAVRTARFAPATAEGVSVSGRLRLTFDFRLR